MPRYEPTSSQMWLKKKMEVKRAKEGEREYRLQGNKVPTTTFFAEHTYLQKVFLISIVLKETGQESWT